MNTREFMLSVASAPLALFGKKKPTDEFESCAVLNKKWSDTALGIAKELSYWRERCVAAEKDLGQREDVMETAMDRLERWHKESLKTDPEYNWGTLEKDSREIHDCLCDEWKKHYTHPDCLKETT